MNFQKQFSQLGAQIGDLLRKLTVPQKIAAGLLALLLIATAAYMALTARGEPYVRLCGTSDARSSAALEQLLDRHGIPYRLTGEGGGAIEVPRDQAAPARWLAAEGGIISSKDSNLDWLFGEGSLIDTESKINERLLESRKRTVEDAVRWSPSIQDARIVVQRGPEPIYATQSASTNSAAVAVRLRGGVEKLPRSEVAAIRALVSGAFNILPQNIQIADGQRVYPDEGLSPGLSEEEDSTRKAVLSTVERLLGRIYRPSEFAVGVLVDLSLQRSRIQKLTYDPGKVATAERSSLRETEKTARGSGEAAGIQPSVFSTGGLGAEMPFPSDETSSRERQETVRETRFSSIEEKVEVPAGEVKGVSVNVVIDRAAIRRVLQAEEFLRLSPEEQKARTVSSIASFTVEGKPATLDQAIEAHRRAQAEFLREQIPMSCAKVSVSAVVFPREEKPLELAAPGGALSWAAEHWGGLLLGGIVLAGLFAVYRRIRAAVPPPLDVLPLETILEGEEPALGDAARRLEDSGGALVAGRRGEDEILV